METPQKWTDEQRNYAWIIMSYSRRKLQLTISPCIASAFVLLHRYFNDPTHKNEPLYILMTSSIALACKIEGTFRGMQTIFAIISDCISEQISKFIKNKARIKAIFGDRDFSSSQLTEEELKMAGKCEIHLLNSIKWNMKIDLPFNHFNEAKPTYLLVGTSEPFDVALRDLCLIMKDEQYLLIPPEVSAAAAIEHSFCQCHFEEVTSNWIQKLKQQYPDEYSRALSIIQNEGQKCIPVNQSS